MNYLLFQLYGHLQAWGSPAPGTIRQTEDHPTKSGVLGLLGACLGITSDQEKELFELQDSVGFACREDIPGEVLNDYNTIWPDGSLEIFYNNIRKGIPIPTDQNTFLAEKFYEGPPEDIKPFRNTILSEKYYLVGALFTICLWQKDKYFSLETLLENLHQPTFTPFLGRKKCLLGMPFYGRIVQAPNLKGAFEQYKPDKLELLSKSSFAFSPRIFWEGEDQSISKVGQKEKQDMLNSRKTWTYLRRTEFEGVLERKVSCTTAV